MDLDFYVNKVREASRYLKDGLLASESDGDTIDLLGASRSVEKDMASLRQGAQAELPNLTEGITYYMAQGKTWVRSYNTDKLISAFIEATNQSPAWVIGMLRSLGVIEISWKWQKLEKAAAEYDVALHIAAHEIEEGDPDYHVGKYLKDGYPSIKVRPNG